MVRFSGYCACLCVRDAEIMVRVMRHRTSGSLLFWSRRLGLAGEPFDDQTPPGRAGRESAFYWV